MVLSAAGFVAHGCPGHGFAPPASRKRCKRRDACGLHTDPLVVLNGSVEPPPPAPHYIVGSQMMSKYSEWIQLSNTSLFTWVAYLLAKLLWRFSCHVRDKSEGYLAWMWVDHGWCGFLSPCSQLAISNQSCPALNFTPVVGSLASAPISKFHETPCGSSWNPTSYCGHVGQWGHAQDLAPSAYKVAAHMRLDLRRSLLTKLGGTGRNQWWCMVTIECNMVELMDIAIGRKYGFSNHYATPAQPNCK